MKLKLNILSLTVIAMLVSCGQPPIIVADDNTLLEDCRPDWMGGQTTKIPKGHFVGTAKTNSEQSAYDDAALDARMEMARAAAATIVIDTKITETREIGEGSDVAIVTEKVRETTLTETVNKLLHYSSRVDQKVCKIENAQVYVAYTLYKYDTKTHKERLKAEEATAAEFEASIEAMGLKNIVMDDLIEQVAKVIASQSGD